ncbi:hypothetical protein ACWOE8_19535 [Enterococcus avium]
MINTINIVTILLLLVGYVLTGITKRYVEKVIKQSSDFEGTAKQRKIYHYLNLFNVGSLVFLVGSIQIVLLNFFLSLKVKNELETAINVATFLFILLVYMLLRIARRRVEKAINQSKEFQGTAKQQEVYHNLKIFETLSLFCMVSTAVILFIYLISK